MLPDVLDRQRMASHLSKAFELNVLGVANAQMGAANMVDPSGKPVDTPQGRAVWPGGTYFTASLMQAVGRATGRPDLVAAALTTGYGVYRTTYEDDRTAFWFDTPALWIPGDPHPATGPRPISAAGRRGNCSWPSRTRSLRVGRPRCDRSGDTAGAVRRARARPRAMIGSCRDLPSSRARPEASSRGACWWLRRSSGDPNFERAVVLVLDHGDDGALGVVLNRPTPVPVGEILEPWADQARLVPPAVVFRGARCRPTP